MFWFGRPPVLRWVGAAVLVVSAVVVEFWPSSEVAFPFAASSAAAGEPLDVEWRLVPSGLLPYPQLEGVVASHELEQGEPITPSDVRAPVSAPAGWWALAVEVPVPVVAGADIRLVLDSGPTVPGVVLTRSEAGQLTGAAEVALVAVPPQDATRVASAVAARQVVVLVSP